MLLDFSVAFDTYDHFILISQLEYGIGVKLVAFHGFRIFSVWSDTKFLQEEQNQLGGICPVERRSLSSFFLELETRKLEKEFFMNIH